MKPPDEVQILLREVCMAYMHHEWPGIIGLDLSKKTYSGCRLSGDGYVRRRNFTGKMTKEEDGYRRLLEEIQPEDLVIMEAGSSSFNLARFLMNRDNRPQSGPASSHMGQPEEDGQGRCNEACVHRKGYEKRSMACRIRAY